MNGQQFVAVFVKNASCRFVGFYVSLFASPAEPLYVAERSASDPQKFEQEFNDGLVNFLKNCNTVVFHTHFNEKKPLSLFLSALKGEKVKQAKGRRRFVGKSSLFSKYFHSPAVV